MKSGKRAICAGRATARARRWHRLPEKKRRATSARRRFDNNLLCIGEKQVFVFDSISTSS